MLRNKIFAGGVLGLCALFGAFAPGCPGDDPDDRPERQGCESSGCHGRAGGSNGIELAHPGFPLTCTDCHGGDAEASTKEEAHIAPAPGFIADRRGYIRNLSVNELDATDQDFLRFVNPGDYRAAPTSCGGGSPASAGSGCHQDIVYASSRSTMATFTGHFAPPRFEAGLQGTDAEFGSLSITDDEGPDPLPRGAVRSITQAAVPGPDAPRDEVGTLMDHYLPKNCTHCHGWSYGRNDATGNFRSSGCTSCHMIYDNDGLSLSNDPSAVTDRPPHPIRHELATAIPGEQCEHCHFQGARIGLLYRGVIEWGLDDDPPFPNIGESIHNHPPEFYLQASEDPAHPADLHYDAGMTCVDCHIGRDIHGDGRIYSSSKFQTAIRCENCHGNVDDAVMEGRATAPLTRAGTEEECMPTSGVAEDFWNCNGDSLRRLHRLDDGQISLTLSDGSGERGVPQIADILRAGTNPFATEAMGRDADGFSHTEVLQCDSCHTAYRQYCFGCHVTMDYSVEKSDLLTGLRTLGAEVTSRSFQSLDLFFIGQNHRGKIGSFCPSMQVFLTAIGEDDTGADVTYFADRIRTSATGRRGFNWAVDTPHVSSRVPQPCTRCHADESDGCSTETARQTYGFGTGRYNFTDDTGTTYDLTQLLDADGNSLVDFGHEGQGPVPIDVIGRALDVCVTDQDL